MRLTPRTILGQAITGTVIVQLLVFGVFLTLSVRRELRDTRDRERARLQSQARIISDVLDESLYTKNIDMFDHVMHSIPISISIRGVLVTDADGKTLGTSSPAIASQLNAQERALMPSLMISPRYRLITGDDGEDEGVQPVVVGGRVLGVVWIRPDAVVIRRSPLVLLEYVLVYAACALVGNLLLLWVLSSSIARPLGRLRRASQQVQDDPNDLSAFPLTVKEYNEAGVLTASVNAMVNEIALQRQGTQDTLNLLDSMLSSAPIGFGFYDREYRYVRLNDHLAKLHGMPLEDHIGRRLRDLLPADAPADVADQVERFVQRVFDSGRPVPDDEIHGVLPGDESSRTWSASYFPVMAGGEVRWVGAIASEVTERKRTEEVMRRSEKMAAAGRLAASIAHEINNPIESVTNLLYLLRTQASLDAQSLEYVSMAQGELARVGEITQQTLRFYRTSSSAADVKVAEMLRAVILLHKARMQSPKIEVDLQVGDDAVLYGYAGELRQLFMNLVGNAIDAMPYGGHLRLRASQGRRRGERGLRITVGDTGVGMPEAVRRRIFEAFFTTKEATGTGLGLWVSDEILTKHHATIQVRSRQAQFRGDVSGTVFRMFFPLRGVKRGPFIVQPPSAQVLADHLV